MRGGIWIFSLLEFGLQVGQADADPLGDVVLGAQEVLLRLEHLRELVDGQRRQQVGQAVRGP